MKKHKYLSSRVCLLTATAALSSTLISKPAFAGTATANLNVSATVPASCTISTNPVSFGNYTTTVFADVTANGSVTTTCTKGSTATITLGQGANAEPGSTDDAPIRKLSDGSGGFLGYNLYKGASLNTEWGNTPGTGVPITGTGTSVNGIIYGKIRAGQNVSAGSYTDTVVATVTF